MLEVTISYSGDQSIFETLRENKFSYHDGKYILEQQIEGTSILLYAVHHATEQELILSFSGDLKMEHYEFIHQTIVKLSYTLNGTIDDQKALMGYLDDGKEAFIYHGWKQWISFLQGAKHTSMEGQKVQVFDGPALLAEGILMSFERDDSDPDQFKVKTCSLITTFGDRTYSGEDLIIKPTGEFM